MLEPWNSRSTHTQQLSRGSPVKKILLNFPAPELHSPCVGICPSQPCTQAGVPAGRRSPTEKALLAFLTNLSPKASFDYLNLQGHTDWNQNCLDSSATTHYLCDCGQLLGPRGSTSRLQKDHQMRGLLESVWFRESFGRTDCMLVQLLTVFHPKSEFYTSCFSRLIYFPSCLIPI